MRAAVDYSLRAYYWGQLRRDLATVWATPADVANPVLFFVLVVTLFPLGVSPAPAALAEIAAGVIWITALLATLLSLETLFRRDYDDGSLEQMVLGARPLVLGVLARLSSHWLTAGLPLVLLSPILALTLRLPHGAMPTLVVSLVIGTPVLVCIGAIGAALTVSLGRAGLLLSLLVLPLFVPVLILGVGATQLAGAGDSALGPLAWLLTLLAAAVTLAPFAIGAALKISVER